jgi:hypothetical protein
VLGRDAPQDVIHLELPGDLWCIELFESTTWACRWMESALPPHISIDVFHPETRGLNICGYCSLSTKSLPYNSFHRPSHAPAYLRANPDRCFTASAALSSAVSVGFTAPVVPRLGMAVLCRILVGATAARRRMAVFQKCREMSSG